MITNARRLRPLSHRIIIAMSIMVLLVGISYCLGLWYAITQTESSLVGKSLKTQLEYCIAENKVFATGSMRQQHPAPSPDKSIMIFGDGPLAQKLSSIPHELRHLPEGFSEILGDHDYFAYKLSDGPNTWIIRQDQFGFEQLEIDIYLQAILGLITATGIAAAIGYILSKAVADPVKDLASEIESLAGNDDFRPLNTVVTNKETAMLAHAFEQTMSELHNTLAREKAFTADVGHELRTPMMAISSSAELLALQSQDPAVQHQAKQILRSCERLNRLVHAFLELARGNAQITTIGKTESLHRLAVSVCADWQCLAAKKGITIKVLQPNTDTQVNAALANSVLDNLLRNAVQYTDSGAIEIQTSAQGLRVSDTGRGIPEDEISEIQKSFVRGSNSQGEGYGWGLSLIRRICEHENWTMQIHNRSPHGSTFEIDFNSQSNS